MFWKRWRKRPAEAAQAGAETKPITQAAEKEETKTARDFPLAALRFLHGLLAGSAPMVVIHPLDLSQTRIRRLPDGMVFEDDLLLQQCQRLRSVGETFLRVSGSLWIGGSGGVPAPWKERVSDASDLVAAFVSRPSNGRDCPIGRLPDKLVVGGDLRLRHCTALCDLPDAMEIGGDLEIVGCANLRSLPDGLHVRGDLRLVGLPSLERLPSGLRVEGDLLIDGLPIADLPEGLDCGRDITISNCKELERLPDGLEVTRHLTLRNCGIGNVPSGLWVMERLRMIALPTASLAAGIHVGRDLVIERCPNFASLGDREEYAGSLSVIDCPAVEKLPGRMHLVGRLVLDGCANLESLPQVLEIGLTKNQKRSLWGLPTVLLRNCPKITRLPDELRVEGPIDIAGASIESAEPSQIRGNTFAWRGFAVPGQALFHPRTLNPREIVRERNAEVRRLLVERYGVERLFANLDHRIVDEDTDPGGKRRLIELPGAGRTNANVRVLDCRCPSTARRYLLEVPATVLTCHQAAAWLAGFDDEADYKPVRET